MSTEQGKLVIETIVGLIDSAIAVNSDFDRALRSVDSRISQAQSEAATALRAVDESRLRRLAELGQSTRDRKSRLTDDSRDAQSGVAARAAHAEHDATVARDGAVEAARAAFMTEVRATCAAAIDRLSSLRQLQWHK